MGKIEEDWAGFSAEVVFRSQRFDRNNITIFIGDEFDDDGEEIETVQMLIILTYLLRK